MTMLAFLTWYHAFSAHRASPADAASVIAVAPSKVKPTTHASSGLAAATSKAAPILLTHKTAPPKAAEEQLCSVNMSDEDIRAVLELLTKQSHLNILLESSTPAKVTLHVENMRLIDVMRHVCALSGLKFLKVSDAYVVGPADNLKNSYPDEWEAAFHTKQQEQDEAEKKEAKEQADKDKADAEKKAKDSEPKVTVSYTANYVSASKLVDTIKRLLPNDLDAIAGPSPETPNLAAADASEKTGTSTVSVTGGASTEATGRVILFRGSQAKVDEALKVAKQLDQPRAQVNLLVTVHDISDDAVRDLGLDWTLPSLNFNETPAANGISVGKITREGTSFGATLAALETRDVARLLASPNVSLLDGEKAFILIGDRINYPVLTGYSANNQPIFSVSTERVGVYLQVAADISTDGYITLTLYPQVSSITGYLTVNGASYPQVSTREAQTTLRIKSGETMVLGGLLQDQDIVTDSNVPLLSNLPFIGQIFKHRTKTHNKSQVIITLRPIVTKPTP